MQTKKGLIDVSYIANLANLKLSEKQKAAFTSQLTSVLAYISKIQSLDTKNVTETSQVTGMQNIFREDEVDANRMLTQEEALKNAKRTHKGYFVVPPIFET